MSAGHVVGTRNRDSNSIIIILAGLTWWFIKWCPWNWKSQACSAFSELAASGARPDSSHFLLPVTLTLTLPILQFIWGCIYIFPTWYINLCTSDPPGTQLRIIMYLIQGLFNLPDILLGLLLGRNIHQPPAKAGVHGSDDVGGWLVGFLLWQVVVGWVMKSEGIAELFPSFIYN